MIKTLVYATAVSVSLKLKQNMNICCHKTYNINNSFNQSVLDLFVAVLCAETTLASLHHPRWREVKYKRPLGFIVLTEP